MKDITKKLTKACVAVGVACLLLGIVGYSQPARGFPLEFNYGTINILVPTGEHFSYGNWDYATGDWFSSNTASGYTTQNVYFNLAYGWTAWILYSYLQGWLEEVTFLYDVNYP